MQIQIRHLLLALGLAGGLVVQGFNSFGAPVEMEADAARQLAVVTGPLYRRDAPARENIVVLLFDDEAVTELSSRPEDNNWRLRTLGPSYADQRTLIDAAVSAGAAAVFLDITYSRRVEGAFSANLLAGSARNAAAAGVPVFFGPIQPDTPLAQVGEGLRSVDVAWRAEREDDYQFAGVNGRPIAALALYRAVCAKPEGLRVRPDCAPALARATDAPAGKSIILTWGRGTHPDYASFRQSGNADACRVAPTVAEGFAESLRGFAVSLFAAATEDVAHERGNCPYHLAIPGHIAVVNAGDPAQFELLKPHLRGRVVMIAAALKGSSDFAEAPGIGVLPGVFQHAMALDNLMTFGDGYKHKPPSLGLGELDWGDLAELALALLGAWLMSHALTWTDATPRAERNLRVAAAVVAPLALVFGAASFAYFALNWAAGDVFGVLGTTVAAFAIARKEPWEQFTSARASRAWWIGAALSVVGVVLASYLLLTWARA